MLFETPRHTRYSLGMFRTIGSVYLIKFNHTKAFLDNMTQHDQDSPPAVSDSYVCAFK